jgi:hypothetical protein
MQMASTILPDTMMEETELISSPEEVLLQILSELRDFRKEVKVGNNLMETLQPPRLEQPNIQICNVKVEANSNRPMPQISSQASPLLVPGEFVEDMAENFLDNYNVSIHKNSSNGLVSSQPDAAS